MNHQLPGIKINPHDTGRQGVEQALQIAALFRPGAGCQQRAGPLSVLSQLYVAPDGTRTQGPRPRRPKAAATG